MSYIGRNYSSDKTQRTRKLDSLTASFNGSTTTFNLTSSSAAVYPGSARNLEISLDGVIQEPDTAYTVSGNTVTFTTAPVALTAFFGVLRGESVDMPPNFMDITVANNAT